MNGGNDNNSGRVAQSGSAPQKRRLATVSGSLLDASSEAHEPRVGSNPTPIPYQSTAARKDVQERPIAKRGLTGASVNGDSLRSEGETTVPAGIKPRPSIPLPVTTEGGVSIPHGGQVAS